MSKSVKDDPYYNPYDTIRIPVPKPGYKIGNNKKYTRSDRRKERLIIEKELENYKENTDESQ